MGQLNLQCSGDAPIGCVLGVGLSQRSLEDWRCVAEHRLAPRHATPATPRHTHTRRTHDAHTTHTMHTTHTTHIAHATQHNTTQHNTTQHNTTQHNITQHNTTQHNTTQHNTTQHSLIDLYTADGRGPRTPSHSGGAEQPGTKLPPEGVQETPQRLAPLACADRITGSVSM